MDTNDEQNERMTLADASRPGFGRKPAPGYEVAVPAEPEAAPLYRVKHRCFLHNRLYEPGEEVRFEGKPGSALERIDAPHPAEPTQARGNGRTRIDKSVI
jgi:hypothetical protein